MFKVDNKNTRTRCEICSKLTIKTLEPRHSGVFIVNFERISHLALVFLLLNSSWVWVSRVDSFFLITRKSSEHIFSLIITEINWFLGNGQLANPVTFTFIRT